MSTKCEVANNGASCTQVTAKDRNKAEMPPSMPTKVRNFYRCTDTCKVRLPPFQSLLLAEFLFCFLLNLVMY